MTAINRVQRGVPAGGRFTAQARGADDVALAAEAEDPYNIYSYTAANADTVVAKFPKDRAAAKAALSNVRGEPDGQIREVFLNSATIPRDCEVRGPKDGRPLLIVVTGGMGRLNVTSGRVIIRSDSSWGNVVNTSGDAQVTVITGTGRKLSTHATERSSIEVIPGDGSFGLQASSDDATITVADTGASHRLSLFGQSERRAYSTS